MGLATTTRRFCEGLESSARRLEAACGENVTAQNSEMKADLKAFARQVALLAGECARELEIHTRELEAVKAVIAEREAAKPDLP